ncbi:MAG: mechanosensitive ion channel family protein [Oscillibacter sp.]|nr:mechanosensitive ion channel family protein [Oscillibacter sp.]
MSFSELAEKNIGIGRITVGDLFSALLTLIICLIVIRIILRVTKKLLGRSRLDSRVQKYLASGIKGLLYLITIVIVIGEMGIDSSSLVALLSVGSLGVTLAAESILGNMAGGLVILSSHPFTIGDFIEADGTSGTVEEITLNHTRLLTLDGIMVSIPNKVLSDSKMSNYTALGRRRICWKVTASYDAPTQTVKDACREAIASIPQILPDPAASVYLSNYGENSIEYSIYCWCKTEDYWPAYFALGENIRVAFTQANVEMTYNHLNVHMMGK